METHLTEQQQALVDETLDTLAEYDVIDRIWKHDHTVWHPDPYEITNRLDWLSIAEEMEDHVDDLNAFVDEVREAGYTQAVLMGMGGSSLAPEVFSRTFGTADGYLDLLVLDSTDPGAVKAVEDQINLEKTLFLVGSKSGSTVETLSLFKHFYGRVIDELGEEAAGDHFVAITDPGSKLTTIGPDLNFRKVFENNPNIGGRYSALSYFGLVEAALLGIDVAELLERGQAAMADCQKPPAENPGAKLGVIMGELAKEGRDKLTLIASETAASFGDWVEQLVAESTGKQREGILPVVGEPLAEGITYGDDRLFITIDIEGDDPAADHERIEPLELGGHPFVHLTLDDAYDLGYMMLLWEFATAIAGYRLGVQPFDQPNVESAKTRAKEMVKAYTEEGKLPEAETAPLTSDALNAFLEQAEPGDYIAVQAFLQPTDAYTAAFQEFREYLRQKTGLATTFGYGPRYLHSTGQLHKGDDGSGLFIQFVADAPEDVDIPDAPGSDESAMTFGVLIRAQALGDAQALEDEARRLIRFDLSGDIPGGLEKLQE